MDTNAYYLVELPNANALGRLNAFLAFSAAGSISAHRILHHRKSLDGTKYIVQGDILPALAAHIVGNGSFITKLGDYINGHAEQAVHDFITNNSAEWIG